ncbi:hypothetical protein ACIBG0_39665 [Nocardia sp. NPDC050630]|uniref:hypothetical protein n=1 Tax=Nocardia sp. NPDC050630 TaxID=3364321 RepID=UPI0037A12430
MTIQLLAALALVVLVLGAFFPVLARWGGFLIALDSLLALVFELGHGPLISLMWLIIGVALWLFGHWIEAYRTGYWRSWLAGQTFRLPGLRALRPAME